MHPVLIQEAPTVEQQGVRYRSKYSAILGVLHIALGVISIILNVIGILMEPPYTYYLELRTLFTIGHGIWSGIFVSRVRLILKNDVISYTVYVV